jgi:hypothetical protein
MGEATLVLAFLTLFIIMIITGFLVSAAFSQYRRYNEPEPWHARLAAAEGKPRHDGKKRSIRLLALITALLFLVLAAIYLALGI